MTDRIGVAILGTGRMGSAMARRLAGAGYELHLWNRTRRRADEVGVGHVHDKPVNAADHADIVITTLANAAAVRAAYLGRSGALANPVGKTFVEMGTLAPNQVVDLAKLVVSRQANYIEAPVLGSVPAVDAGRLAIMAACPMPDSERALGILRHLGEVRLVGQTFGSAGRLKLIANSMLAIIVTGASELVTAGVRAGLDPEDLYWALSKRASVLRTWETFFRGLPSGATLVSVNDLSKDVDLAADLYEVIRAATPLTHAANAVLKENAKARGNQDVGFMLAAVRDWQSNEARSRRSRPRR